jgi:hypothetical protein
LDLTNVEKKKRCSTNFLSKYFKGFFFQNDDGCFIRFSLKQALQKVMF